MVCHGMSWYVMLCQISVFTDGVLAMEKTLLGVIQVRGYHVMSCHDIMPCDAM